MKLAIVILLSCVGLLVAVIVVPHALGWPFYRLPGILLGLLALLLVANFLRTRVRFQERGYEVLASNERSEFEYREKAGGGMLSLSLPGHLIEYGHLVYHRLPADAWRTRVPDWAAERQLEIEGRILEDPFHNP